ncbi:isocitrate lyase/PEP mutase family protein [Petroclostridium sp. X23]|uniref:isocitrate lyase/PEP mutase family protein n=1 Tax=Petroclostridium sp. X23 TaxID=3045146 RepID=UPI0024AD8330|nr:isocitrate lyase/PEP mutase family protein [Petroclostridium sp. X23]WHH61133.1 isocitrate lyase/PEP mutase family protein [Petroclostridium sp. X23]
MSKVKALRELINSGKIISAPGAYDVWSAKLIENAGFDVAYMTGYGVSASVLGRPDIGLMTFSEVAMMAKNIAFATNIPIIADCDTGFGNTLNVIRCVEEFEAAGVAAIQLEDQLMPKRCGHMEGKVVIPKEEMVAKIRAAAYARKDPDFVIIARTDARAANSFDDAMDRAKAYVEAGADVIFFEAPQSVEEIKTVAATLKVPLISNMVENGKTPLLSEKELQELGYRIVIYPLVALYAATKAVMNTLDVLKGSGSIENCLENGVDFPTFNNAISLPELRRLEESFYNK